MSTMTGELASVTDASFADEVLRSARPVLVEYWATWCGPCRMLAPVLGQIAVEQADRLRVVKLDTDQNPMTMRDQKIMGVPTMILYRDGQPVASLVGARSKHAVLAAFEPFLD
jgi:thioredoxin 1